MRFYVGRRFVEEANGSGWDYARALTRVQVRYGVYEEEDSDYLCYHLQPCSGDHVESRKASDVCDVGVVVESVNVT